MGHCGWGESWVLLVRGKTVHVSMVKFPPKRKHILAKSTCSFNTEREDHRCWTLNMGLWSLSFLSASDSQETSRDRGGEGLTHSSPMGPSRKDELSSPHTLMPQHQLKMGRLRRSRSWEDGQARVLHQLLTRALPPAVQFGPGSASYKMRELKPIASPLCLSLPVCQMETVRAPHAQPSL